MRAITVSSYGARPTVDPQVVMFALFGLLDRDHPRQVRAQPPAIARAETVSPERRH